MYRSIFGAIVITAVLIGCGAQGHSHKGGDHSATTGDSSYPIDYCIVSGEDLHVMGEPVVIDHDGRVVKFCCDDCIDMFKKSPAKYLAKLDAGTKGDKPEKSGGHMDHDH